MSELAWLNPADPEQPFPPLEAALKEPDGLLAAGGGLEPSRLLSAYRQGIFPWYETGQPILWWSPDPRAVLFLNEFKLHRSLRKALRNKGFSVDLDTDFAAVVGACAAPRGDTRGTWITREMQRAYIRLHTLGHAHSVEVRDAQGVLVGGLYGVAIGRVFFGESMFSRVNDASKIALTTLACQLDAWGFPLIDCQQDTAHLARFGARPIARRAFARLLDAYCGQPGPGRWVLDEQLHADVWQPGMGRDMDTGGPRGGIASRSDKPAGTDRPGG
ncbi:leucyl/phenylalanyl-tRNA--protein transferase [Acidihalobacter prosperus]|uniref:Leucyl/phenylalanyl-tRNA--protein transferase n=1 Tax=Acidihalobacter prosperus TaxID=160660 RepID=A0A1A6C8J3_9GAMM|nr:leucyl/phenylalanyl-tRNA--protein transferase [Acidihalobacter prosperus]OBS10888.1 Leucyl/phenylalanyl-tRNA--protein transferase [Acidihalobacter prosperus]